MPCVQKTFHGVLYQGVEEVWHQFEVMAEGDRMEEGLDKKALTVLLNEMPIFRGLYAG